jgi:hypothetical protein
VPRLGIGETHTAELISGKVMPSRIDCGARSSAESPHWPAQKALACSQGRGQQRGVAPVDGGHEDRVEDERGHADQALDDGVDAQRVAN